MCNTVFLFISEFTVNKNNYLKLFIMLIFCYLSMVMNYRFKIYKDSWIKSN